RCRPLSKREDERKEKSVFSVEEGNVCLTRPGDPADVHRFAFDLIYGPEADQIGIWEGVGLPVMDKAFAGYNGTIFAYGQTGSGKTFSMMGVGDSELEALLNSSGVIPRMNRSLFERLKGEKAADPNKMFLVTCSYFEIYNEVVYDLLDPDNRTKKGAGLEVKEHPVLGIFVKASSKRGKAGLQEMVTDSPAQMSQLIMQGMASRTVGSTAMNDTSSRSHSVFTIKLHQKDNSDKSKNTYAKINLVDLAGSERQKSTESTGQRLREGANINKSLSALGNVINALVELAKGKKAVFVPYRNSKLTRVLQESLGGNSLTAMLAALSPAACNFEETLGTLKYASRTKTIKLKAIKNEEASQISRLNDEIQTLKEKLSRAAAGGADSGNSGETYDDMVVPVGLTPSLHNCTDDYEKRYQVQLMEMEAAMKSTWEDKVKNSKREDKQRQLLLKKMEEDNARKEREREMMWDALEEKGDIELSVSDVHVMELLPDLPSKRWAKQVRELVALEQQEQQEDTVFHVYLEAL
ncbi:unnamed protein product, partial [Chrysoparadoxa australica]